ncbi:putative Mg2+ transporter-C (MgtC) family protein [Anaerosphaera aminiphila DSM 21120]|uniref:Putative Mg2+ transporter-C (MgtC) family protein n=1 Tax=Anaerosphaera aminiphila DSM 21120 TaxID=1120995 RepID=A0A1M5THK0_9FIRM|nr:MgtC/SapB family protein [Anaerosphaera aminiphila]SHH50148.1 putative Mg2+ transporter-C (MgtC) family protein [Anaerosphaera aminiphila DSM 21120]
MNYFNYLDYNFVYIIRILIATLCGFIIGYERESKNKGAGIKTHCLVAMASSLCMIISAYAFYDSDPTRIAAQIVSGVGFLGAGLIFVRRDKIVSGITTAAGIWGTAIIAMAIGAGMIYLGVFTTILMFTINFLLSKFQKNHLLFGEQSIAITVENEVFKLKDFSEYIQNLGVELLSIKLEKTNNSHSNILLFVNLPQELNKWDISQKISDFNGIKNIEV